MNTRKTTRILVEGAMLIALATVLASIKFFELPQGGSITLEMLPLVIMGYRNGTKWGCLTGFTHGLLQMILGFSNVMYCQTLPSQIGCILLDYLLAFTVLGLGPVFAKLCGKHRIAGAIVGSLCVGILRFLCSFLSGWLIWGDYSKGLQPVIYSLVYNGTYMLPDTIILVVVMAILAKAAPKLLQPAEQK